jgi:uncharacterized protein YjbI with pentapeptide repeats
LRLTPIAYRSRLGAAVSAAGLVTLVAALATAPSAAAKASGLTPMASKDAVAALKAGMPLDHVEIEGSVMLGAGPFDNPFECTNCRFDGEVSARNTLFKGLVDFAGSTFKGSVTMSGATFGAPALFGSPSVDSSFGADANFTLATFGDLVDFERTTFAGRAIFELTRFRGDAIFAGEGSAFLAKATFERASFGAAADFRQRVFVRAPTFERTTFVGRSDFSDGTFVNGAMFNWARFGTETTFLGARLGRAQAATTVVDNVRSAGSVDFTSAKIGGSLSVTNVDLGGLSFENAIFDGGQLHLENVRAPDFLIDIGSLPHVLGTDREGAMGLLEASAKAHGDLALANDAHYRLQSLKSDGYWWPFRALDVFFYRWIAGYLVRPDHPLFTLLALALLVSLVRALALTPEPPGAEEASRLRPRWRLMLQSADVKARGRHVARRFGSWFAKTFWPGLQQYGHELLDTLRLIWPGSAAAAKGRRSEAFGYRVLFVCMLVGFANSNPTLRQMLDALL